MRKYPHFSKLRVESLEERTLLAVMAGGPETAVRTVAPTESATWVINTLEDFLDWTDDDDVVSLREAIGSATTGDTIVFDDSLAGGTITLSGSQLEICHGITIDASAIAGIMIDAAGQNRVFYINGSSESNPVELISLTITGGYMAEGGGIYNSGILTMTDCTVSGNTTNTDGGGIFNIGTLTFAGSTISGNIANNNGGGIFNIGTLTFAGSTISGNIANNNGGGICNDGTLTITGSTVLENTANDGGGVYNNGSATIMNCAISDCTVTGRGGGVYNGMSGMIIFNNSSVSGNSSKGNEYKTGIYGGGGIYNNRGTVKLTDSTVSENSAFGYDDAFSNFVGGGVYNGGTTVLVNSVVFGNSAQTGGGIYNEYGTLTFSDSDITGNSSLFHSGGIYNGGTATFTDCTISNNSAHKQEGGDGQGMQYYGGGIYNKGRMTLETCVVSGNTVYGYGGGIYNNTDSDMLLVCSAIFGNSANRGGGVYTEEGSLTFLSCTISGNCGGGIRNANGVLALTNTISSLNDSASSSDLLSSNGSFNGGNNIIGFDPGFVTPPVFESGKLVNFDVIDLSLSSTSWAIDRGNNEFVESETDLAGNPRIYAAWLEDAVVDIGAYEYQERVEKEIEDPGLTVTTPLDVVNDTDRLISLREAIFYAMSGDTINFGSMLADETIRIGNAGLLIDKPVCINASGVGGVTIDAENKTRIFEIRTETCEDSVELIKLAIKKGGIHNYGKLRLTDCIISENKGHAIYNNIDASISLTNCTISDNSAAYSGGGICNDGGTVVLDTCGFFRNSATEGAAIWNENGAVTAVNCSLSGNSATLGAGFYNSTNGTAVLTDCTIAGNSSQSSTFGGGGIYILAGGTVTLTNCLVSDNSAKRSGAGIYNRGGLVMNGCTVAGNSAKQYGGGIYNDAAKITLYNTIVASNTAKTDADLRNSNPAGVIKAYNSLSSFLGWKENVNCLVYDSSLPLFVDATNGDYALAENSQVIDNGNNTYVKTVTDLAGNPRIVNGIVDLGAYEYQGGSPVEQIASPTILTGNKGVYVSYGANRHQIRWNACENISGYELQYSAGGSRWTTISVSDPVAVVTGLIYGQDVKYRVRALGDGVSYIDSDWSAVKVFNVCPIDINNDGDISGGDRALLGNSWLSEVGEDEYRSYCDINGDGDIGGADRVYLSNNWLLSVEDDADDLLYPPAKVSDAVFAGFASADLAADLSVF